MGLLYLYKTKMMTGRFNCLFLSPTKTHLIPMTKIGIIYKSIVVYLEKAKNGNLRVTL